MTHDAFLQACADAIGAAHVLTAPEDQAPYLTDWRKRFTGRARAVLRPASPEEVAALVRLCAGQGVPIVPQGGNTGLCGGATPDSAGDAVVISLQRMQRVRAVDPINNTITVDAGCILASVQEAAAAADRLFPLSLAAEGSCTIGGNLATNAGGTAVLRYGNARELCLGVEAVLPDGALWNGLRGLRKDNTGYDLRDLLIGAEGTLGIITGAMLKLFPQPRAQVTALAALQSPRQALAFLSLAQGHAGTLLTGFELMSAFCLELVRKHYPQLRVPFGQPYPQYVLLELSDLESEAHARGVFETLMEDALAREVILDAAVAESVAQSRELWNLREHIPLAQADEGKNIKHDIAVPISRVADFIEVTDGALAAAYPGIRMVTFGHLGDGNLHYNVSPPSGQDHEAFLANQPGINRIVHDSVHAHGGSISAEHGIGQLKREDNARYKSPVELAAMRAIKQALDPRGLMNPGKVL
ncbi:FAD-binding oxidoreductase [Ralstonia solanacearum]|uniref:FAD-binding oxidoreductase n=1 Tax=Ralstonia solanacearum TaxID=305 RepID=UPI0005AC9E5D|nr:FAD-binding oxidoreductase [Ralstonia solanacearum]AST32105.2 FAD-binding oxidoreductase [Ralstonia solanacearum]MBB6591088.1 FAD-binding oxidoreductase [Ralstonia solanacearum]MBB6595282.1 FAD-binding oxidoreductase [Ralstonia solanacearum]MDB0509176.1 FAD-binding oxidoreductase [Ralstonia solanacearum]MDB0515107.1 FAD-binding oxidoreductase [Ralstonia solanacearum]